MNPAWTSASVEHAWADRLLLLWAARREKRIRPPFGCYRRKTDPEAPTQLFQCKVCHEVKDRDAFDKRGGLTTGRDKTCKRCRADRALVNRHRRLAELSAVRGEVSRSVAGCRERTRLT